MSIDDRLIAVAAHWHVTIYRDGDGWRAIFDDFEVAGVGATPLDALENLLKAEQEQITTAFKRMGGEDVDDLG
jgi:hypothetical protein